MASRVTGKRAATGSRVLETNDVVRERIRTIGRVVTAGGIACKCIGASGGIADCGVAK